MKPLPIQIQARQRPDAEPHAERDDARQHDRHEPDQQESVRAEALAIEAEIRQIVDVQVAHMARRLAEQDIGLELTDAAKDELAKEGYDSEFGARPLKRAIQRHVQNAIAEKILAGELSRGHRAVVDHFEPVGFTVVAKRDAPADVEHATVA